MRRDGAFVGCIGREMDHLDLVLSLYPLTPALSPKGERVEAFSPLLKEQLSMATHFFD